MKAPSPALTVSLIALAVALGGTGIGVEAISTESGVSLNGTPQPTSRRRRRLHPGGRC